jgi:hypothetical protein
MHGADVNSTYQSATHSSIKDIQNAICGTKLDLEEQIKEVQQSICNTSDSLRENLEADRAHLHGCLEGLAQAQQVVDSSHHQFVIEHNRSGQRARAIFGTDSIRPLFDLTVSENVAEVDAVMSAGVYSPQTMQALLRGSQPSTRALVLQVVQNHSLNTDPKSFHFVP